MNEFKPTPVNKNVVCSVCGLDWDQHKSSKPPLETCVVLLKEELAKRPKWPQAQQLYANSPTTVTYQHQVGSN